jgi:hypothetical protein
MPSGNGGILDGMLESSVIECALIRLHRCQIHRTSATLPTQSRILPRLDALSVVPTQKPSYLLHYVEVSELPGPGTRDAR